MATIPINWTPSFLPTIFWYDASDLSTITRSGNQVNQMLDKSGNGWTLAPTGSFVGPDSETRTLNGLNVLDYVKTSASSNVILENNSFNRSQPFCVAAVMSFDDEGVTTGDQDFLFSGTNLSNPRISLRRTTTNQWEVLTNAGSVVSPVGTAKEGFNYIPCVYFNTTATTIRVDGSILATGSIANNSFTELNIGGNFGNSSNLDGLVGEIIAFTDPDDQEIVEGYLAWKWGLTSNLPLSHTYKNNRPKIDVIFDGPIPGRTWKEHRRLRLLGYI